MSTEDKHEELEEQVEATEAKDSNASEDQPAAETKDEALDAMEKLKQDNGELKDKYLRLYSEFENFRRRTSRENADLVMTANKGLIVDLLPVLDDFERGLDSMDKLDDIKSLKEGVVLIYNKLKGLMEKKGLAPIESKGQNFDPESHEALTKIPAQDESQKGKVIDEIEKGYTLNDRIIRYAKVVVAE